MFGGKWGAWRPWILCAILLMTTLLAACAPATDVPGAPAPTPTISEAEMRDAASFAQELDLPLEEALARMRFQASVGAIQPALEADLPATYAGLWIRHEPDYGIVIALTEGNEATIQPYIEGQEWAPYVELTLVANSLAELIAAQSKANEAAQALNIAVSASVDVRGNRVELYVGNLELFYADLAKAGLALPASVVVLASGGQGPLPETNRGTLIEAEGPDGRPIFLPRQPPAGSYMEALMLGTLVEVDGCLRLKGQASGESYLVIWPNDVDLIVRDEDIELINRDGDVVARVGEPLRLGGGGDRAGRQCGPARRNNPRPD